MPERVIAAARARFSVTVRPDTMAMSATEAGAALTGYDYILPSVGDDFGAAVFAAVPRPRARVLANFGVGYNHIDLASAREAGVAVSNTPDVLTDATADIGLTLLLMTARHAGAGERMLRAGRWRGWYPTELLGQQVTGKTIGIIGMGRIGQAVAHRTHYGFGMAVRYFNRSAKPVGLPAQQVSLPEAMAADFVVVTVPGGAATRHLIGAPELAAMKPAGILVNIARGDVVDENALIAALQAGQIAGAGLDVYEHEPRVPEALIAMENVTLLPHLGSATLEVREAMGLLALDNLIAFDEGRPLVTGVT